MSRGGLSWTRWTPRLVAAVAILAVAGCGAGSSATPRPATPEPIAFDLALVKANFAEECEAPIVVDETFCVQVDIAGMTAEGDILTVPTGLNPASTDRAAVICETIARVHFDGATGDDLGYGYVGILDMNGANAAACRVD